MTYILHSRVNFRFRQAQATGGVREAKLQQLQHSGPMEEVDCSLPPPNMAATKTGEPGANKARPGLEFNIRHTLTQAYT